MLRIFRNIRHKLLSENKMSKYLIYAIGEILLVVVGILIALNVNNYNENQKLEAKIVEALKEIHRDLSEDIIATNDAISNYRFQDSIIHQILTNQVSYEDYIGNKGRLIAGAGLNFYPFTAETNGYELLMSNSDKIPARYQDLVNSLKNIYTRINSTLQKMEQACSDYLLDYWSHLGTEKEWFSEYRYNGVLSEESINYFTKDPYYKNHLTMYSMMLIDNHNQNIHTFRLYAEDSYRELTKLLNLDNIIATDSTYYNTQVKDYERFAGTYQDSSNTITIAMNSDGLYRQRNNERIRLFPISENSFIHEADHGFINFELDSSGRATNYNWHLGYRSISMKKID